MTVTTIRQPVQPPRITDDGGRALTFFVLYRFTVALLLLLQFFYREGDSILGQANPSLFKLSVVCYLLLVAVSGVLCYWRPRPVEPALQAIAMVVVDIGCITLMMHASGGIQTGMGALVAVSIAAGGVMVKGHTALLLAAIATLTVLAQQTAAALSSNLSYTGYPQAGMLGASFFAIATLALVLSQRASRTEQLVSRQELDLANLAQLNEYVIQHMQTGILVVDNNQRIRLMNDAAWHLLGMPDAKPGMPLAVACDSLARQLTTWGKDSEKEPEIFQPATGGKELKPGFSRLGRTETHGTVIFLEDEASVSQQAQQIKLASLGRLTASIAHEIRNPLGAIGHAEQLLRESLELPPAEGRLLEIIGTNTQRVNAIIENVLQLSRRSKSRPQEFRIKEWLMEFIEEYLATHQLHADCFSLEIQPEDTVVFADSSQLRQILNNLCDNSLKHFHRERDALRIQLQGGITRDSVSPYLNLTDNGPGISQETARQIFEPFFTTKGSGTGLGLYIAKELSESNRMRLDYQLVTGGGSRFRMSFPGIRTAREAL